MVNRSQYVSNLVFLLTVVGLYCSASGDKASDSFTNANAEGDAGFERNASTAEKAPAVEVILFGATGDLATRYLWRAIFRLYLGKGCDHNSFFVHAVSRKSINSINKHVGHHIANNSALDCDFRPGDHVYCVSCRETFLRSIIARNLKNDEDFEELRQEISNRVSQAQHSTSILVYLAVPPFAYQSITNYVNKYLRIEKTDLRVILEKPFGHDYESSARLLSKIGEHLKEDETYRIDHYLGKQAVNNILLFRKENEKLLEGLLAQKDISLVEVVMKESLDCRNRTSFYDKYGIILDVMQNHLTEVLARVIMDIPMNLDSYSEFLVKKKQAIDELVIREENGIVLGQYNLYNTHRDEESKIDSLSSEFNWSLSRISTFAAVLLYSQAKRWQNIPMLLVSGKQLNEKSTYVRLWFKAKDTVHRVSNFEEEHENSKEGSIIFYIYSARFGGPAIVFNGFVSEHHFTISEDWERVKYACDKCQVYRPKVLIDPYTALLKAVASGEKNKFIGRDELLAAWNLWDGLVHRVKEASPLLYDTSTSHVLDFEILPKSRSLNLLHSNSSNYFTFCNEQVLSNEVYGIYDSFSVHYLSHKISLQVACLSKAAFENKRQFHIALPGGSSVHHVVNALLKKKDFIIWDVVHFWLVDERCVGIDSQFSNGFNLNQSFFSKVPIKHTNIHTILRGDENGDCKGASIAYENDIHAHIPNQAFDLIILGLGQDGHIASIFPHDVDTVRSENLVTVTDQGPIGNIKSRVTFTPLLLKGAQNIMVLVFGEQKKIIYHKICDKLDSIDHLQVLSKLQTKDQTISWYVDVAVGPCHVATSLPKDEL